MDSRHKQLHEKANDRYLRQQYREAAEFFTQALEYIHPSVSNQHRELQLSYINKRSVCYLKLEQYENCLEDCNQLLSLSTRNRSGLAKALTRKTQALSRLGRVKEAYETAKTWTNIEPKNPQASKEMNRLKKALQQRGGAVDKGVNNVGNTAQSALPHAANRPPPGSSRTAQSSGSSAGTGATPSQNRERNASGEGKHKTRSSKSVESKLYCTYCDLQCATDVDLHLHCMGQAHQAIIMSDDGRDWTCRPPPRGITGLDYVICPDRGKCRFGEQCTAAHSEDELGEWRERYRYREMKLKRAREKQLHGVGYAEQLLEKWMTSPVPLNVVSEAIEDVKVTANSDLNVSVTSKSSVHSWIFTLHSKPSRHLHRVALLYDIHRPHFYLAGVSLGDAKRQLAQELTESCQEWTNPAGSNHLLGKSKERLHRVKLQFTSQIFGTFRQSVVFDFGGEPALMRRVSVDAVSPASRRELEAARSVLRCVSERWDAANKTVAEFRPPLSLAMEEDRGLLGFYVPPHSPEELFRNSALNRTLTRNNYRDKMHDLLYIEEMARFKDLSRYNIRTTLQLSSSFHLVPSRNVGARYSVDGQLFALLRLNDELSEDTRGGKLVLNSCSTVLLAPYPPGPGPGPGHGDGDGDKEGSARKGQRAGGPPSPSAEPGAPPETVYECAITEKGKGEIYLTLPKACVNALRLRTGAELKVELQFQLNRLPLCEMHFAVDKQPDMSMLFPNVKNSCSIPWTPSKQWDQNMDPRLNAKQREAIIAMTTPLNNRLPPIFLVGPYGTGKTFTLAHATKLILQQPNTRILICTHSNSAADLYIKDYLHAYVEAGFTAARPLRIYFKDRWVPTVHPLVRLYCVMAEAQDKFAMPGREEVTKARVVVATLSTSRFLCHLDLGQGFFTHILIDEAAQAMECETIMPLALANLNTRVVLAGDYMQISPEVHSDFCRDRNLHISLLERLYDLYPAQHPCKILLCENYRSHEAIVGYTSRLFYDGKLLASGKQAAHGDWYPLTFFTTRGEDVQEKNSTSFYNNAEVFEIAERVEELQKAWPAEEWGALDETGIGVVSHYADQVFRIRSELRKRRLHNVSVERVMNVQGKQFRVLFISTVRTHNTCKTVTAPAAAAAKTRSPKSKKGTRSAEAAAAVEDEADYGFLSNDKLLNTAITRAQSLVAVVGDPVSLCSIGKCRILWENFIKVAHENKSLFGITYDEIRALLSGVEMKKTYILNPLAKEFIPQALRNQVAGAPMIQGPPGAYGVGGVPRGMLSPGAQAATVNASLRAMAGMPPYGHVRPGSPIPTFDPVTGQRLLVMPMPYVVPMHPLRMLPAGPPFYAQGGYVDPATGLPLMMPPYGFPHVVRHSPTHLAGVSSPQLSPKQPSDKSSHPNSPKEAGGGGPANAHWQSGSPSRERERERKTSSSESGCARTDSASDRQEVVAKLEELRINEEYNYYLRTMGPDYASNFLLKHSPKQQQQQHNVQHQTAPEQPGQPPPPPPLPTAAAEALHKLPTAARQQGQSFHQGLGPQLLHQQRLQQQQQQLQQQQQHQRSGVFISQSAAAAGTQRQTPGRPAAQQQGQLFENSSPHGGGGGEPWTDANGAFQGNAAGQEILNMLQHGKRRGGPRAQEPDDALSRGAVNHQAGPSPYAVTSQSPRAFANAHSDAPFGAGNRPEQQSLTGQPIELRTRGVHMPRSIYAQQNSYGPSAGTPHRRQPSPSANPNHLPNNGNSADHARGRPPAHPSAGFFSPPADANFPRPGPPPDLYRQSSHEDRHGFSSFMEELEREEPELWVRGQGSEVRGGGGDPRGYQSRAAAAAAAEYSQGESQQLVSALPPPQRDDCVSLNPADPGSRFSPIGTGAHLGARDDLQSLPASMSYASALRAPPKPKLSKTGFPLEERGKTASPDPLMLIKDLGNRQNKDGFYSYFN